MKIRSLLIAVGSVAIAVWLIAAVVLFGWFVINLYRFGVADIQQPLPQILATIFLICLITSGLIHLTLSYMALRAFTLGQMFSIALWVAMFAFFGGMMFATSLRPPYDPLDSLYISRGIDTTIEKADPDVATIKYLCEQRARLKESYIGWPWPSNPKCE